MLSSFQLIDSLSLRLLKAWDYPITTLARCIKPLTMSQHVPNGEQTMSPSQIIPTTNIYSNIVVLSNSLNHFWAIQLGQKNWYLSPRKSTLIGNDPDAYTMRCGLESGGTQSNPFFHKGLQLRRSLLLQIRRNLLSSVEESLPIRYI